MTEDLSKLEKTFEAIIDCYQQTPTLDYKIMQSLRHLSETEKEKLLTEMIPEIINKRVVPNKK
ncbi:MAG: hypothetical protein J6Y53_01210 [Alphaproteobacteria bacterium]|nr:hypothetical protein [Alphaproteobacteria bacterium]